MISRRGFMKAGTFLTGAPLIFLYGSCKPGARLRSSADDGLPVNIDDLTYEQAIKKLNIPYRDDLPQMFVSGDSISVGYGPALKLELKDQVNVVHRRDLPGLFPDIAPERYNGDGASVIKLVRVILNSQEYNPGILLLNFGLHDTSHGTGQYEKNLKTLIRVISEERKSVVWVQTTLKATGHPDNTRIMEFNTLSSRMMDDARTPVIELNRFTEGLIRKYGEDKILRPDMVHFKSWAEAQQGKYIAAELRNIFKYLIKNKKR